MSDEPQSLADRVRQLAHNADLYRETDPDPDAQIVATAEEIDSNMTYLGLDDVIVQLASEVEEVERSAKEILLPIEVLKPVPGDMIFVRLPKATHPSIFESVQAFMQQKFPTNTIILAHEDADINIFPPSEYVAQELLLRNADAWEAFLWLSQRAEAEWGDESPQWLDTGISQLEFALKGDPGHQEPAEFQKRRKDRLREHGPRLQWGQSQITETPDDADQ